MKLKPIQIKPSKNVYLNIFYKPLVRMAIYIVLGIIAFLILIYAGVAAKSELDIRATNTQYAVSTLSRAQTLTAIPTNTSTPTATITPTFTVTPSPTSTLTPTVTPVFTWSKSIVDSGTNDPAFFLSMDINVNGKYYIAYFLDSTDDIMIVEGNGKSWKQVKNLSQLNKEGRSVGFYVNLDIRGGETPYLTYLIFDKGSGRSVSLNTDGKWDIASFGQNLSVLDMRVALDSSRTPNQVILSKAGDIYYQSSGRNLTILESGVLPPNSTQMGAVYYPISLAVDSFNNPYVCFSKNGDIKCRYKQGTSWILVNVTENGIYPSLQIDDLGNWHLAYYDYKEKTLKYAYLSKISQKWTINTVDATGDVGWYPSLKVDENNLAHISYYDASASSLKYAVGRFGGWSVYTIDNDGDVGLTSSLVLDLKGNPAVAYYDSERKRIIFTIGNIK